MISRVKEILGGIGRVIQATKHAILGGNLWIARLDIIKFYESFTEELLREMQPLQKNVISLFATGGHMNAVVAMDQYYGHYDHHEAISQARRGIPQGSALSGKIASSTISLLKWSAATLLFNWADDFLIVGESEAAVIEAGNTLIAKVSALPGGHFSLKLKHIGSAEDGFVFLGHRIALRVWKS